MTPARKRGNKSEFWFLNSVPIYSIEPHFCFILNAFKKPQSQSHSHSPLEGYENIN